MFLKKCAVGEKIIDLTLLSALNECQATMSYVDLSTVLPSNISEEDMGEIFHTVVAGNNNFVLLDTIGKPISV